MNDPSLDPARRLTSTPAPADLASAEAADQPPANSLHLAARRRELELELSRIRSEASAARLQARAAELELMIRRLSCAAEDRIAEDSSANTGDCPPGGRDAISAPSSQAPAIAEPSPSPPDGSYQTPSESEHPFRDWNQVRTALAQSSPPATAKRSTQVSRPSALPSSARGPVDSAARTVGRAHRTSNGNRETGSEKRRKKNTGAKRTGAPALVQPVSSGDQQPRQRKRPTPWVLSAAVHVALFIFLSALTLSAQRPKDQVALSAAASDPQPTPMETFSIETPQPEPQPEQLAAAPVDAELSPVGELAAADLELDAPPAPPTADSAELLRDRGPLGSAAQLTSETKAQTAFCGVAGGGNHFVYLVDSSGSMGDAFSSARAELLRSIDQLGPEQRFYVIFFDAEPDYMRLSAPDRDEPASVLATPQRKRQLRRWAMQVAINPGRAPYEPLRFALELRPDVIFLLSDGEFPESIEQLLREENRVENLFGDASLISIVHTIGYHSRQGESRMRSIAQQNGGQYRHVPAP